MQQYCTVVKKQCYYSCSITDLIVELTEVAVSVPEAAGLVQVCTNVTFGLLDIPVSGRYSTSAITAGTRQHLGMIQSRLIE